MYTSLDDTTYNSMVRQIIFSANTVTKTPEIVMDCNADEEIEKCTEKNGIGSRNEGFVNRVFKMKLEKFMMNLHNSQYFEKAGFAPYEKRITELLKVGKDKRALKVAKRKLGTHKRAKKKREEMSNVLRKLSTCFCLHASAPAFVFFNTLFIWGVPISLLWNVVFNLERALLLFGLHSIISADPGLVAYGDATSKGTYQK
ncbi:hypothetical protein IFM89_014200 [Coptis chinensis]|uniref:60S ribosomal protein L36 n=1 Tax=Coptis chinensis TaxID=261450 RepID=A0A835ITG8_9MAGN|nr:hypothetical protein IFM89_014200 [Coptis chinensis]